MDNANEIKVEAYRKGFRVYRLFPHGWINQGYFKTQTEAEQFVGKGGC